MKQLIVAACLIAAGSGAAGVQAQQVCDQSPQAKEYEATIARFMASIAQGDEAGIKSLMATPQDYEQDVAGPLRYASVQPGTPRRVEHKFRVHRLCTYGGHGDEIMTDAEFFDDAKLIWSYSYEPRSFYLFFHFHYTAEGKLRMASPYIK